MFKKQTGMSVIEVVLAAAIFVIFSSSAVRSLLQNYNANRTGAEYTVATQFASEGLEAAKSIKNQGFHNLVNSAGTGVVRTGSVWAFGGANNTLTHNSGDNYVRTIKVEDVQRSTVPPAGNIVSSGGTLDLNTKKITSTVNWNFSAGRPETFSLVTYLSDFKKQIAGDGIVVHGDTTSATLPKFHLFTDSTNTFSPQADAAGLFPLDTIVGKTFKIKTSPIRQEAIAGYINNSGVLRIICYNGNRWTGEFSVTVGGTGTTQRFGLAYETNTGDALVVYSTNTGANNEMGYRTKSGTGGCGSSNWSGNTNINALRTTGVVQWIRMESSPLASSNNIAIAWVDAARNLSAMQWTGSSFGIAEPANAFSTNTDWTSTTDDIHAYDIAYESLTGNLMLVFGEAVGMTCTVGSNCMQYVRYTNAWTSPTAIPTVADRVAVLDATSNPNTNEIITAGIDDNAGDLSTAYWSGSAWTGRANVDATVQLPPAGAKNVATGWLINGATTRYVVVYNDSGATNIGWYVGNGNAAPVAQTDFGVTPIFSNPQTWYDIQMDPVRKDRLMLTVTDNTSDLNAKRLVMTAAAAFTWTNSNGATDLETDLGQAAAAPYGFAYWRNLQ